MVQCPDYTDRLVVDIETASGLIAFGTGTEEVIAIGNFGLQTDESKWYWQAIKY